MLIPERNNKEITTEFNHGHMQLLFLKAMRNPGVNASPELNNQDPRVVGKGLECLASAFYGVINRGNLENVGNVESR